MEHHQVLWFTQIFLTCYSYCQTNKWPWVHVELLPKELTVSKSPCFTSVISYYFFSANVRIFLFYFCQIIHYRLQLCRFYRSLECLLNHSTVVPTCMIDCYNKSSYLFVYRWLQEKLWHFPIRCDVTHVLGTVLNTSWFVNVTNALILHTFA